jgi:2-oxoglutarate ferredoxin oxidoreductase subunit alpha
VAEEVYADFFRGVQAGLVVEQSHQGQLYRVLRMFVNVPAGMQPLARSGSNPILPRSIVAGLQKVVTGLQRQRVAEVEPAG